MKFLILWLVLFLTVAFSLGSLNWYNYRFFSLHGVMETGVVVGYYPKDHRAIVYQYTVHGQTYSSEGKSWKPTSQGSSENIGKPVIICYDPDKPERSILGDPHELLKNETVSILLAAFFFVPTICMGMCLFYRKRKA